jgi:hypothetical protein
MPPRYAYWTILIGDQPTAFRAGAQEDLMPTFKRLQAKNPDAKMMWFQNGKLWPSRLDAQEAMRARGEMGRRGDDRQSGFRSRDREFRPKTQDSRPRADKRPDWKPRSEAEGTSGPKTQDSRPRTSEKLDWKPKGEFTPAPKRSERPDWQPKSQAPSPKPRGDWKPKGFAAEGRESRRSSFTSEGGKPKSSFDRKPEWKPKGAAPDRDRKPRSFARPEWKPSGDDSRSAKPEWKPKGSFKPEWTPKGFAAEGRESRRSSFTSEGGKPKGSFDRKPEWKSKTQDSRPRTPRTEKLDWKPRTESGTRNEEPGTSAKRKWVPKAEYKKSLGIEAKRDEKWRPGGEHRDPKQKYKDAKKAKWSKFKKTIRTRWEAKGKKKSGE